MLGAFAHLVTIVTLTLLTQIGGLAWLMALAFRRHLLAFLVLYATLSAAALVVAPQFGRVALTCWSSGQVQMQSWLYCALNRNYMAPAALAVLKDTSDRLNTSHPGTTLQALDASFPFFDNFPLLPHLSHDDGEKVDLAFHYLRDGTFVDRFTPSPIGYFAFEQGPTQCQPSWPTLRWDLSWLQPWFPEARIDEGRTKAVLQALVDDRRVEKVLIEPHLTARLGLSDPKLRFQGCRAARHDDHIHFQL